MEFFIARHPAFDVDHVVFALEQFEHGYHVQSLTLLDGWFVLNKDLRYFTHAVCNRLETLVERYRPIPRYTIPNDKRMNHIEEYRAALDAVLKAEGLTLQDIFSRNTH